MKKRSLWILWLLAAGCVSLFVMSVRVRMDEPAPADDVMARTLDPATGAVLVDIDDDASLDDTRALARRVAGAIAPYHWPTDESALGSELSDEANLFRVTPPSSEVDDVLAALRDDSRVEAVEVERTWSVPEWESGFVLTDESPRRQDDSDRFVPNDPYYRYQWHLDQIGMPEAWTRQRGDGAVVAIIDTGVAYRDGNGVKRAPDLANTRLVDGYDFVDNDATPDDEHGHGTHVAGTVAQSTHNGVGVAGVAPGAAIMPLKVLDGNGSGGWGAIAAAIRWAADHGANVINMSLGGGFPSRAVQRAIDYAHEKGVIVVAAAGNSSRNRVEYPGRHRHVIAVGAVRFDRTLTFYSNHGEGLDVVAPGGDTRVDQNNDGMPDGVVQNTFVGRDRTRFDYLAWQGTSMASPHAAGVAALLYASGVHDPDTVEKVMKESADDLGDQKRFGSGLIQAPAALRMASQGTGAARGGLAFGLVALVLLFLRRREKLAVGSLATGAFALIIAGGLGVIPWHWFGVSALAGPSSLGLLGNAASWLGSYGALLALSVVPAFVAVISLLHVNRLRSLLVGLSLGSAAFLLVEALLPTAHVGLLPHVLVGPWLVINGLLALGLGWLVAARSRG